MHLLHALLEMLVSVFVHSHSQLAEKSNGDGDGCGETNDEGKT